MSTKSCLWVFDFVLFFSIQLSCMNENVCSGIMDCSWKLLRMEGILAFYKGFTPKWLRVAPYEVV